MHINKYKKIDKFFPVIGFFSEFEFEHKLEYEFDPIFQVMYDRV